jgi:hypothetical protein
LKSRLTVEICKKAAFYNVVSYIIEGVYFVTEYKDFKVIRLPQGSKYYDETLPTRVKTGELWLFKKKMRNFRIEVIERD